MPGALTLRTEVNDTSATIHCTGALIAGETEVLRSEVKSLFPRIKKITLDLTGLIRMDSMGLGSLVGIYASAKASGCELKMVNVGERIRKLFIVTNLISVFEDYAEYDVRIP